MLWTWSTLSASRIGVMNDLFVDESARGAGAADALIGACAERVRAHGGTGLEWMTAHDNQRAQAVYERVGGKRDERWLELLAGRVAQRHHAGLVGRAIWLRARPRPHGRGRRASGPPAYWAGTAGGVFAVRGDSPIER